MSRVMEVVLMSRASCCSRRRRSTRLAPVVAFVVLAWCQAAFGEQPAIESPALVNASLVAMLSASPPFAHHVPPPVAAVAPLSRHTEPTPARRPAALPALYVSFAVLQGLDAHSTLAAVRAGRAEANPAMRGLVTQPGPFVAAKLAASAGTVYLTERLWKRHRTAAVVLMLALNSTYGAIVANNYRGGSRNR